MSRTRDYAVVIAVFCLLIVLPAGVTRVSSADTVDMADLHGTVSVLQVRGPADRACGYCSTRTPPTRIR